MAVFVYRLPLRAGFRGLTQRSGVLLSGPGGWAEFAPFLDYDDRACIPWLEAAVAHAVDGLPEPRGEAIAVNVTVPAVDAEKAFELAAAPHGCATAKVKVAERRTRDAQADPASDVEDDLARLEAVRAALGSAGRIRIDVNQAWDLDFATRWLPVYDRAAGGLEYAEQPVAGAENLAALRRRVNVPLAADESLRLSDDPLAVKRLDAADVAVLKAHPMGGVEESLRIAEELGLPAVVSSALDSAVGISAGLALAASLPELPFACGLATGSLFDVDVAEPLPVQEGHLVNNRVAPDLTRIGEWEAPEELADFWLRRLIDVSVIAGMELDDILEHPAEED